MNLQADRPGLLKDPIEIEKRRARLLEPHIAPLTNYARSLRHRNLGEIPDFDPNDGGINSRILFLFEKPGPKAFESGFISRNNDDPTAENIFHFMKRAEIPRKETCIWNVIPGWNGTIKIKAEELNQGVAAITDLSKLLPKLSVIVSVGKKALKAKPLLETLNLVTIGSTHPSPVNRAFAREKWDQIPNEWARAKNYI